VLHIKYVRPLNVCCIPEPQLFGTSPIRHFCTGVKLAVTSPSRHFRDLAKKPPTQKRANKLKKNSKKTYYGNIILQTTQTYYFKLLSGIPLTFRQVFSNIERA